jgi:hypothetical protein
MQETVCGSCGTALAASAVLYDERGEVRCQRCLMASQAADSQKAVAMKVKRIAYGGPVIALVALFWNPVFVLTIGAIGNGIYVLRSVKDPQTAKLLGDSVEKVKALAIAGMVLGAITGIVGFLVFPG